MPYLALYRKYRSQTFAELSGQEHIIRTLQNSITQDRISHSYLFTGPRGTGKTSAARLLAKALNCENGPRPDPCNDCETCKAITEGSCVDVLEMDAASESGVEEVRERIVAVSEYHPNYCRYKIFIIDEVHDLSPKGFDALLKTIEEPPSHVVFILATTEFVKVPPTIRSRCQKFEFRRGSLSELSERLAFVCKSEGWTVEPAALGAIARMADGGYRDALTLLEQAALTADNEITLAHVYDQLGLVGNELLDAMLIAIKEADIKTLLEQVEETYLQGKDARTLLESMLFRLSDLTRAAYGLETDSVDPTQTASAHEVAVRLGRERLLELRSAIGEAHKVIRDISLPRIWLESELVRIATKPAPQASPQQPAVAPKPARTAAVTATPVAPKVAPTPVQTGDPALDKANLAWSKVVAKILELSKGAGPRLVKTQIIEITDKVAKVGFERKLDHEFVVNNKKGLMQEIEKLWGAAYGDPAPALEMVFFPQLRP